MTTAGQVRNFYPAYRAFVFGCEVSADALSVSVTLNDARAPSTAQIVLASKDRERGIDDRYAFTEADAMAMARIDPDAVRLPDVDPVQVSIAERIRSLESQFLTGQSVEAGSYESLEAELAAVRAALAEAQKDRLLRETEALVSDVRRQIRRNLTGAVRDPVKAQILTAKVAKAFSVGAPRAGASGPGIELASTVERFRALSGLAHRYSFQVGDSIFHSNDPVRIFFRDPRDSRAWFHMFAGYVSDTIVEDDENGVKTVTLICEDVTRALRYARLSTSPGLVDIDAAATNIDLVLRTFFNDDLSGLTLLEFLSSMIFGFTGAGTLGRARDTGNLLDDGLTGTTTVELLNARGETTRARLPKDGCGLWSVRRSMVFVLGSGLTPAGFADLGSTAIATVPVDDLAVYQAVVDHRVRVTDLAAMALEADGVVPIAADALRDVDGTVPIERVITAIGEHPEIYPVDGGRFIMLAPSTLGVGYNLGVLFRDFKGVELKSTFTTRLAKIYDVLERLGFSFYATPRGDLMAEMPLHDFDPEAFGTEAVSYRQLARVLGEARARVLFDDGHSAGPFADGYHVARRDTVRMRRAFSDEKVRTLATCEWSNIPTLEAGGYSIATGQVPARRLLESLVPQFGVRLVSEPPTISITDPRAAELYCQMLLNRFNGEARMVNVQALPQLSLLPNRPMKFTHRSFVGTLREVTHTITWGERGDASMDLRLDYVRGWDGSLDAATGKPFYAYLGGFRANPQNLAVILGNQTPPASSAELTAPTEGE